MAYERQQLTKFFMSQGFLGKVLLVMLDQMIDGMQHFHNDVSRFKREAELKRTEEYILAPSLMLRDDQLLHRRVRTKLLRTLTKQSLKVQ
jgi:hypothetical protein